MTKDSNNLLSTLKQFYSDVIKPDQDKLRSDMQGEMSGLRSDMQGEMKNLRKKMHEDILDTLAEFYNGIIKPDMESLEKKLGSKISGVDARVDNIETKLDDVIKYIKEKDSPSRREFQNLKYTVEKIEASN